MVWITNKMGKLLSHTPLMARNICAMMIWILINFPMWNYFKQLNKKKYLENIKKKMMMMGCPKRRCFFFNWGMHCHLYPSIVPPHLLVFLVLEMKEMEYNNGKKWEEGDPHGLILGSKARVLEGLPSPWPSSHQFL